MKKKIKSRLARKANRKFQKKSRSSFSESVNSVGFFTKLAEKWKKMSPFDVLLLLNRIYSTLNSIYKVLGHFNLLGNVSDVLVMYF